MIVMCDQMWLDPDLDARNGIMMAEESDMLRLDSMIMMVQLSIRNMMEEVGFPEINIICEKVRRCPPPLLLARLHFLGNAGNHRAICTLQANALEIWSDASRCAHSTGQ